MMRLSERRARERGRRAAGELRFVETAEALAQTDDLDALVALGVQIEVELAPLREIIGPTIDGYSGLDEVARRRVDIAASEALPVIEHLTQAEALIVERAKALAAERGLAF